MKELETRRLKLRKITAADTRTIFDTWASDPQVTEYLTWNPHESVEITEKIVASWLEDYEKEDCLRWGIQRKWDKKLIGMIDIVGYHHGAPVIGYCSGKKYWNRGYMTEACRAVVEELFALGFGTVVIEAMKDNIASSRVIEKVGFTKVLEYTQEKISEAKPYSAEMNSYRIWKDEETRYEWLRTSKLCPVCGKQLLDDPYEICSVCGWENDPVQRKDPAFAGGANKMSLNEARIAYQEGRKIQ